jgi:O-antigen ligase
MSQVHPYSIPHSGTRAVIIDRLVWLAVLLLPITGLKGVSALGELKGSASIYVFLLIIALTFAASSAQDIVLPRAFFVFATCLVAWIAITSAVNFEGIATAAFHDRSGFSKLVNSCCVIGFGLAVVVACLRPFRTLEGIADLFLAPLVLATIACAWFSIPEIGSWFSPVGETVYNWTTRLFHTEVSELGRSPGRLISLAFEAPDMAYFTGFSCPWLLLAYRLKASASPTWGGRALAAVPLALCMIMLLLTNSRTGLLMLAGLVGAEFIFWFSLRFLRRRAVALVLILILLAAAAAIPLMMLRNGAPPNAEDISTTSRLALLSTQIAIFLHNPLFGVGLGQFGFHAEALLPAWAWDSYEILNWFEKLGELPPSFNVYGRLGAELGLVGLAIWYGCWGWAVARVVQAAPRLAARSPLLYLNAAVFGSAVSLTLGGLSNDAFRRPETWVVMAIVVLHAGRTQERAERPAAS